jgi:integrase
MNDIKSDQRADENPRQRDGKDAKLSPDGKWKSFAKVPNLLQYVPNGMYYGRTKINGKIVRQKLETTVHSTAKLRLADFLKEHGTARIEGPATLDTFNDARLRYERSLDNAIGMPATTRRYRAYCIKALFKTWGDTKGIQKPLADIKLPKLKREDCEAWAKTCAEALDEQYYNNVLGTFRAILKEGSIEGARSPLAGVKRLGVKPTRIKLPEPGQFATILEHIETSGAGQSKKCADFVRFLAFTGCRLWEARQVTWPDVDFNRGLIVVHNAKTRKADNAPLTRDVPMIPDARALLGRLRDEGGQSGAVCGVGECEKSLTRACKLVGIPKLTHHDLRHLFATRCIESGVPIQTVAAWLGHRDGGALAMKVYGHLRSEHSLAMAAKVTFAAAEESI